MAYFENPNADLNETVKWANYSDVCILCLREKMNEKRIDSVRARKELSGQLENQPVFKIRHAGSDMVVCKHHLEKTLAKINNIENGGSNISKEAADTLASGDAQSFMKDMPTMTPEEPEKPHRSKRSAKHNEQD